MSVGEAADLVVNFSQVDTPNRVPGVRWIAELVDADGFCTRPYAIAWLSDFRTNPLLGMVLDFLCVPLPEDRRRGYGTRLVRECEARWPKLILTDAITPEGEAFAESLLSAQARRPAARRGLTGGRSRGAGGGRTRIKRVVSREF